MDEYETNNTYETEERIGFRSNNQRQQRDFNNNNSNHMKKFQNNHNYNNKRRRDDSNDYQERDGRNKRSDDRIVKRRRDDDEPKRSGPKYQHQEDNNRKGSHQRKFFHNQQHQQQQQGYEYNNNNNNRQNLNQQYDYQRFPFSSDREFENGNEKGLMQDRKRKMPYQRPKKTQRCRDYDGKGICVRGDECPYDHGVDRIIVDKIPEQLGGGVAEASDATEYVPTKFKDGNLSPYSEASEDVYRPYPQKNKFKANNEDDEEKTAEMSGEEEEKPTENVEHRQRNSGRGGRGYNNNNNNNAPYSRGRNFRGYNDNSNNHRNQQRPQHQQQHQQQQQQQRQGLSNTTLLIKNIPQELNTITHLNEHFKNFGTIVNIKTMLSQSQALVKFRSRAEALKGLQSPAAVFGNRFVKVLWARASEDNDEKGQTDEQKGIPQTSTSTVGSHPPPILKGPNVVFNSVPPSMKLTNEQASPFPKVTPNKLSPQEILKEIQRHKDQLIKKQMAQQEQLLEVLEKKKNVLTPQERATIMEEIKMINEQISSSLKKQNTALESTLKESESNTFVRARDREKERLDRELESIVHAPKDGSLGSASTDESDPNSLTTPVNGVMPTPFHHVGRGRGMFRGRGSLHRGYPSRGRALLRGERSLVLDNRPTSILISSLPTELLDENILKTHFQSFGEIKGLTIKDTDAVVVFNTRKSAEAAFISGRQLKTHALQLSWYQKTEPEIPKKENDTGPSSDLDSADLEDEEELSAQDLESFLDEELHEEDEDGERSWKHV